MTPADIARGLELCRGSRWNQTAHDWELFLKLSPQGCRAAVKEDRVVGTVTTVNYENRFAWIGMVLVAAEERGQGIGTQLLREAIGVLKDVASIKLDATPAGHPVYQKLGFQDEYPLSRMETVVSGAGLRLADGFASARLMTDADLVAVCELDRAVFGADRRAVLQWMFAGAPEYAWAVIRQNTIVGYTFGRHGFNFAQLGPIVAQDCITAKQLVSACLRHQAGKPFVIDASRHDGEWGQWLETIGFREQRPFIRMFYGANSSPGLPEHQFAILGPEFG